MDNFSLTALSPLAGYERSFEGVEIRELPELALVAVSVPNGADGAFATALNGAYGVDMPDHGGSLVSKDGKHRLVRFALDQVLVMFEHAKPDAAQVVAGQLKTGYCVDQTDNWVCLSLSGPKVRAALERVCALNLHADKFPIDRAERTALEHLGAIVMRTGRDEFVIMSASSSAESLVHVVETSCTYVA